jgi:serine/threonine-protein kinase HipA
VKLWGVMTKALGVWWDGARVGVLRLDEHGDLEFVYDGAWLEDPARPAVSIALPKGPAPFNRRQTRTFFAGLLPEDKQRDKLAQVLGVSKQNDFGFLEALGGDVAGALSLWPESETPPVPPPLAATQPLSDDALLGILARLPGRPMLAGEGELRVSLAGAQQKLPVVLVDNRIALPAPGQASTHILKPSIDWLAGSTANEALSMRLAAALSLPVASVEPRRVGDRPFLLVERYDRHVAADGVVRRRHQEDFCQALGISPEHKYASEGGPTFPQCFELLRRASAQPAADILRLVDAAIFNVIVGNADAHGKNLSLLYGPAGVRLAPLYDLMCTAAYPEVHTKMAMKVAKRATLEEFTPTTWEEFAGEVGVGRPFVRRRAATLAQASLARLADVVGQLEATGFGGADLSLISDVVGARARRLLELDTANQRDA